MADRAHIRLIDGTWTFQRAFDGANGFFRTQDGRRVDVAQAPLGYEIGNDRLVAAVETLVDTSTGSEVVTDIPAWTVALAGTGCTRTVTTRDKTLQEVSDEKDAILARLDIASRDELYALAIVVKGALALMLEMINVERGNHGQGPINLATFVTQFELHENDITVSQFKNYLKDRMG